MVKHLNIRNINMDEVHSEDQAQDKFMKRFKYYKANKPPPSLEEVINVDNPSFLDKVTEVKFHPIEDDRAHILGLQELKTWQAYSFKEHPGLFLIRNPFTSLGQRYWVRKCLEEYPRKPNKMNIDIDVPLDDWWQACYENGECNRVLLKKLRWTTLGYHHNWDSKVYSEDNRTAFPSDLAELCDVVAKSIKYTGFKAEAAIVNYYHMNSTLSAHTDHSEVNLEAPLFSFSFGQSAIFLIGGRDKSKRPSAILLQSGDIMVMSKEARLCYHAVPKILPAATARWNDRTEEIFPRNSSKTGESRTEDISLSFSNDGEPKLKKCIENQQEIISFLNGNTCNEEWSKFNDYVEVSRINMNVRQVLNDGQCNLTE